jgi:diaminobutyrate-2-oxoglutarate transaminase
MIWGIDVSRCGGHALARAVSGRCFKDGLIVELAGRDDCVLKIIPPLTIDTDLLARGCNILKEAFAACTGGESPIARDRASLVAAH